MGQASPRPGYLALVVDDNEFVRNFVRDVLAARGFEVYVADDGKSAAAIYAAHPDVSLIVTDILMPLADGIDFILKIRSSTASDRPQPRIIAISGGGFIDAKEYLGNARGFGADITLEKPFAVRDLMDALSKLGFE